MLHRYYGESLTMALMVGLADIETEARLGLHARSTRSAALKLGAALDELAAARRELIEALEGEAEAGL